MLSSPLPSVACPDNFILKDMKLQEKFQLQYNKKAAYLLNKVLNNNSTKINDNNDRGRMEKITCASATNQLCYLPNSKYVSLH